MATLNAEILADQVRHAVGLQRYGTGVIKKIIAHLDKVDADLVKQLIDFDLKPGRSEASRQRLQRLLDAVREIIQEGYAALEPDLRSEMLELAKYEVDYQQQLLTSSIPVAIDVTKPSVEQLAAVVNSRPFQGAIMKEWAQRLEENARRAVSTAITTGFTEGETVDQIVRRVRGTKSKNFKDGALEVSRREAEAIVRTAVNHVATSARDDLFRENSDIIKGVVWVSAIDNRTSPVCRARDGKVYPIDSGPRPPAHWNCLPADMRVFSPTDIHGATQRLYAGVMIDVGLSNGKRLSCTPNHPVLTSEGWLSAGDLTAGAVVISMEAPGSEYIDNVAHDVLFRSNSAAFSHQNRDMFHGDGRDGELMYQVGSGKGKETAISDIVSGQFGAVSNVTITGVWKRYFFGMVYNLETEAGFYIANGIVTHNCRSSIAPITKSWRELGIDEDELPPSTRSSMDGQVPEDMTYGQWLRTRPRAEVEDIMGKTKAKLFLDGNLPIEKFVNRQGEELSLAELRKRDAEAFKRAGLS